jgi:hypothetical protein
MEKNVVRGWKRRHDAEMKLKDAENVWQERLILDI